MIRLIVKWINAFVDKYGYPVCPICDNIKTEGPRGPIAKDSPPCHVCNDDADNVVVRERGPTMVLCYNCTGLIDKEYPNGPLSCDCRH